MCVCVCAFNTKDQEGSRFSKHNKEVLLWTGPESPLRKGHSHSRAIQVCAAGWGRFSWHVFFAPKIWYGSFYSVSERLEWVIQFVSDVLSKNFKRAELQF